MCAGVYGGGGSRRAVIALRRAVPADKAARSSLAA
jgi:hypothetical protein